MNKSLSITLLIAGIFLSCLNEKVQGPISLPRGDQHPGENGNGPISSEELPDLSDSKSLYFCGVIKSHDKEQLVLYKDGVQQFCVDCSEDTHISSDADSHFLIDGALYTTYSSYQKTYIKKNGEELIEYEGKEHIKEMLLDNETIWTLCIPYNSSGFNIRKNDELAFSVNDAIPISFYMDQKDLLCTYTTELAGNKIWHVVKNTNSSQIENPHKNNLIDIKTKGDEIWYLTKDGQHISSSHNDIIYNYELPYGFSFISGELLPLKENEYCAIIHLKANFSSMLADLICIEDKQMLSGAGEACYYYTSNRPERRICLSRNCEKLYISDFEGNETVFENVVFPTRHCACQDDGKIYVCISQKDNTKNPFIWSEGKKTDIKIKGTLTGICISHPT